MKKSKILIPAFAVLALSVGASVTGTVAWFTANRSVSFSSSFGVMDSEGALSIKLKGNDRTGTSIKDTESTIVDVDGKLTNGSYAANQNADGSLYVANLNGYLDDKGDLKYDIVNYRDLGNIDAQKDTSPAGTPSDPKWKAGTKKDGENSINFWYGVSWEATFTLGDGNISGASYLLIDLKETSIGDTVNLANKGFRIAVMGGDKTKEALVLSANPTEKHYVDGVDVPTSGTYPEFSRVEQFSKTSYTRVVDDTSKKTLLNDNGYIATFPSEGTKSITLTFVAWFEGSDPNVKSGNATGLPDLSAKLSFYARRSNVA